MTRRTSIVYAINFRRTGVVEQLGPDAVPVLGAHMPAPEPAAGLRLCGTRIAGFHVSPTDHALVEVDRMHADQIGEFLPDRRRRETHAGDGSNSICTTQALRYGASAGLETNAERRRRKLLRLIERHTLAALALLSGLSPVYLKQLAGAYRQSRPRQDGTRAERGMGDGAARAIERGLDLPRGWLDAEEEHTPAR